MKRSEIENMLAGREMDALIAEKVMGYVRDQDIKPYGFGESWLPPYSTDIAFAWEVVEVIGRMFGKVFSLTCIPGEKTIWNCWMWGRTASADTPTLAICRAALLAVMEAE